MARDNTEQICGPCQGARRGLPATPPEVPAQFWEDDDVRAALASRHMGKAIRAYRHHPWHGRDALRQQEVARWAGINQPQLSRIENGSAIPHLDRLIFWAQLLGIPPPYLWFDLPGSFPSQSAPSAPAAEPEGTVEWPLQVGRPPARPRAFQHRPALANDIWSAVTSGGGAVLRQVVATGDGGVGKTQLAAAAFSRARESEGVELLVWVNATSRESVLTSYAHARRAVEPGTVSGTSTDDAAEAFLGWLGATSRSWLVVLDDVADPADVRGLWPEGRSGRVLATTRRRDLAPAGARQLAVGVFTPEESHHYLMERLAGGPANPAHPRALDDAAALSEDLGCMPAALAQAAAVILNEGLTCAKYRRRFADRSASFDRLFPLDASADDYAHTVATTWSLAVERADHLRPEGLARPALYIAAAVDPNGVPDDLWGTQAVLAFLDQATSRDAATSQAGPVTSDDARAALRNLHRLSLITHEPGGGAVAVRTHALVQRATLEPLGPERRAEIVQAAADALVELWPAAETDPAYARVLRQNTATLAARDPDVLWRPEGHEVVLRAGQSLGDVGLVHDAITYWTDTAAVAQRLLGPDHPQTLTARQNVADWHGVAGNAPAAARALEELVGDYHRVLGPDHPDTLTTRNYLADWHGVAGNAPAAARGAQQLLDDCRRVLGPEHPNTLAARHSMAFWRGVSGDAVGAARAFEELLHDRSRTLGASHPDTFDTRQNAGRWRGAAGDPVGAVRALEELLHDRSRALGPRHPDTFDTRLAIAWWRGAAGDRVGAARAFEEVVEDAQRTLGPDHLHTLNARHGMARWRGAAGDTTGAGAVLAELLEDRSQLLGARHPQVLGVRIHLAWCQGNAGDSAGAAGTCKELLDDHIQLYGPDHPHTLAVRQDLVSWQAVSGDATGAAEAFGELAHDYLRILGPDHPQTLTTRHSQARWRGTAGDPAGAAEAFEALLADRLRALGPDHPHTLATRHALAYWRGAAGDVPGAVEALAELRDECQRVLGPDHAHTRTTRRHLQRWRQLTGADTELAEAVDDLFRNRLRVRRTDDPYTLSARMGLADWRIARVRRTLTW